MIQFYQSTLSFMNDGKDAYKEHLVQQKQELYERIKKILQPKYYEELDTHFI